MNWQYIVPVSYYDNNYLNENFINKNVNNTNVLHLNFIKEDDSFILPLFLKISNLDDILYYPGIQTLLPVNNYINTRIYKFDSLYHKSYNGIVKTYLGDKDIYIYWNKCICLDKDLNIIYFLARKVNFENDTSKLVCYLDFTVCTNDNFFYKGLLKKWIPALISKDYEVIVKDLSCYKQQIPNIANYEEIVINNLRQQQNFITSPV